MIVPAPILTEELEATEPITVVDYDPSWPAMFEALREGISKVLGDRALAIEHVGSTAVSGLAAKPIIDLDVLVRVSDLPAAISALETIGYRHRGNLGIQGREAFHWPSGTKRHHLYLCPENSVAFSNHLAFRDHLRANPQAASNYAQLKSELALRHRHDRLAYTEGKSAFIEFVLKRDKHTLQ
jgi:GrpB-like predicted nucleotidyltransferase (UPF0157 family)